jgi:diguanylate cyclase (GGDEF)-like protein
VAIADINFFKELNDRYGHDCGDRLLKALSDDLQKSIRKCDTVARWGGDEFLLLLPETNVEDAMRLAERVRRTVEERRYVYEGEALPLTITLGISVVRRGDTIAGVIKKADMALYEGKRAGRNCVRASDGAPCDLPIPKNVA